MTPCCSSIGPLPKVVPPGGAVEIPVEFRPGARSGRLQVSFVVETDSPERPTIGLALIADLTPTLAIEEIGDAAETLRPGQEGRRILRVTCRREGDAGMRAPDRVEGAGPLEAKFLGEPIDQGAQGDLHESTRDIEVTIPASAEPGYRRQSVRLGWSGGQAPPYDHLLSWRVRLPIEVSPPGLVVKPAQGPIASRVVVRCADRPFRITRVSGAILAAPCVPAAEPARWHPLALAIDPGRAPSSGPAEILIETDHPDQPEVLVSILVLPDRPEVRP